MAIDTRLGSAPLWLAAFAGLVAVIGWETDWGRQVTPAFDTPSAKSQPVAVALLPDYTLGAADARRETVERPAFVPTRRPAPPPAAAEPPKPRLQRGQFVLTGTAVVDKQAIAFLREASSGKSRTVRKGDTINGITVVEVKPDGIVLAMGDESEPLPLKVAAGPRTTIQPPVPVPPGTPPGPGVPGAPGQSAPGAAPTPVPGQAPAAPVPRAPVVQDNAEGQSLLERRRAARAAQAAAEAAARGATPSGAAQPQATTPGAPDPGWAEVYRRMQQPRN